MSMQADFPRGKLPLPISDDNEQQKEKKGSKDRPSSRKRQQPEAAGRDFLFGGKEEDALSSAIKRRKTTTDAKQSKTKATAISNSLMPLGGGGVIVAAKKASIIESLSFHKLAKGIKWMACVRQVYEDLAIFSLPNLWTGYMLKTDEHPDLTALLQPGQYCPVVIVKAVQESTKEGPRRRIQVSCLPDHVNSKLLPPSISEGFPIIGQVSSIEDHGVLVDLGWKRRGFLPFSRIEGEYVTSTEDEEEEKSRKTKKHRLIEGSIVQCLVHLKPKTSAAAATVLPLSLVNQQLDGYFPLEHCTPSIADLPVGSLVHAKVETQFKNGIAVAFGKGGVFRGAIEAVHFGGYWIPDKREENMEWKQMFHRGDAVTARILAVDAATKLVRLTMQPHLLALRPPRDLPAVGTVLQDAVVVKLDAGVGALLALPDRLSPNDLSHNLQHQKRLAKNEDYVQAACVQAAYVHISKATDDKKLSDSEFAKRFAPSTTHTLRILSTDNIIEGIATGATSSVIVEAQVLTHSDIEVGQVYRNVVVSVALAGGGVLVDLGMGIRGLIPPVHMFDQAVTNEYRLRMQKVKYGVGARVNVRVLSVNTKNKQCVVTAKKSLIKADPIITAFESTKIGDISFGFVSKVDDQGLFVTFFGGVYGRVTAHSLVTEMGIERHKEQYNYGDVLQCRVVGIKKRHVRKRQRRVHDDDAMDDDDDKEYAEDTFMELTLSLRIDGELEATEDPSAHKRFLLRSGAVLPPKSLRVIELVHGKKKEKGYVPGYAIVRIKSKYIAADPEHSGVEFIDCKLPYDQLQDHYEEDDIKSVEALDQFAASQLSIGTKIEHRGLVLADPKKSKSEYSSGIGKLAVVSIRPRLVEVADSNAEKPSPDSPILANARSHLYVGAKLIGYVAEKNDRFGAFVRFLDGVTGLLPKKRGGLGFNLFDTVQCKVSAWDVTTRKLLLGMPDTAKSVVNLKVGDIVESAEVIEVTFHRAKLKILDDAVKGKINARIHCTMARSKDMSKPRLAKGREEQEITDVHPFYRWQEGMKLLKLRVVAIEKRRGAAFVELSNLEDSFQFIENTLQLVPGKRVSGVISAVKEGRGLWVLLSPGVSAHIPALEISDDVDVLNNLKKWFPIGARISAVVMDKAKRERLREKYVRAQVRSTKEQEESGKPNIKTESLFLSLLLQENTTEVPDPSVGDLKVAKVNRRLPVAMAPALMLEIRGGYIGRCCITELDEPDDWENMPIGNEAVRQGERNADDVDEESVEEESVEDEVPRDKKYPDGIFVACRILSTHLSQSLVDVSLRRGRLEGDLEDDEAPSVGDVVPAYVVQTNSKGCFLRLSRVVEGRTILKELSDGFLPNPGVSYPMGRLVLGKVTAIRKSSKKVRFAGRWVTDVDMRESVLIDAEEKLCFEDIKVGSKYKGTVSRLEDFGVFVKIDGSDTSGLVHKSECSDNIIRTLEALFNPGDPVKVLVVKKDEDRRKIGLSMKASHFEDDEDSEDDSSVDGSVDISDDEGAEKQGADGVVRTWLDSEDEQDSADDKFASKLVNNSAEYSNSGEEGVDVSMSEDDSQDESDKKVTQRMDELDTNIGFNFAGSYSSRSKTQADSSDEDENSSDNDDDGYDQVKKSSHKSRRKQALRRKEEEEVSRRETALADGTADDNPETVSDFERLLASSPNSSELWIRFMAYHLSIADIPSAREVAEKAFQRIEMRQEREKMNVWCALITLELKYGSKEAFQKTIDRACQHSNPKHIYLRVCEILEKEAASTSGNAIQVDEMYSKMCKKFKSKKKVWLAYMENLLKNGRHEESYAVSKRALLSLPSYKHIETLSKFAQIVFEHGSPERARTLFDGLLAKYPKRLDLFFVYVDKEVKIGDILAARALFEKAARPQQGKLLKLSDKQMKSVFKKWYAFEEQHGDDTTRERVKDAAREYVAVSS